MGIHRNRSHPAIGSRQCRPELDTPDRLIVVGSEGPSEILQIRGTRPGGVFRDHPAILGGPNGAQGDVKGIQDVEGLEHRVAGVIGWNRRLRKDRRTDET